MLEAVGDASGYLEASADGGTKPFLHPLREKEVLRLFHEFKSQHADGVCRVPRFDRLLRLKFPTESKEMISAMMSACISREQSRAQAAAEKTAHSKLVEQIFETLDEDGSGTISINEFLQLSKTIGLPKSKLRAIFAARDTDGASQSSWHNTIPACRSSFPRLLPLTPTLHISLYHLSHRLRRARHARVLRARRRMQAP